MMCAKTERLELFKKLLKHKADPNGQTPHGKQNGSKITNNKQTNKQTNKTNQTN
jgi:hypothetical protein